MNNLPLQPLAWIEANHPNGVYFEKTNSYIKAAICFCSTLVTDYVIRHDNDTGMYVVNYGGRTENEYHTLEEAKEWCEYTHYASKMQPYVKPSPTWIDVNERLPEKHTTVLVVYHAHFDDEPITEFDVCTAFFDGETFDPKDQLFYMKRNTTVVRWMPIPKFKQGE